MSTSAEYKPSDNLVPRLIERNQFRMELAQVVTSFLQTLLIRMQLDGYNVLVLQLWLCGC